MENKEEKFFSSIANGEHSHLDSLVKLSTMLNEMSKVYKDKQEKSLDDSTPKDPKIEQSLKAHTVLMTGLIGKCQDITIDLFSDCQLIEHVRKNDDELNKNIDIVLKNLNDIAENLISIENTHIAQYIVFTTMFGDYIALLQHNAMMNEFKEQVKEVFKNPYALIMLREFAKDHVLDYSEILKKTHIEESVVKKEIDTLLQNNIIEKAQNPYGLEMYSLTYEGSIYVSELLSFF